MNGRFLGIPEVKYRLTEATLKSPPPSPPPVRVYNTVHGPREGGYT